MAIKLERYFSRIRPHVTGCPDITIRETLILVLRDICQRVNVWTLKDELYLVKGIREYELLVPDQSEIATIQALRDGEHCLHFKDDTGNKIRLDTAPDTSRLCQLEATLKPVIDATEIPEAIYAETADYAPWGVLADLQMMEDKSWTNPGQANVNYQRYERTLFRKRLRALTGNSGVSQKVTRKRFV